jgi:hypothetical protein
MTREEQEGISTVRDLLLDFKKDLLKCLESYLVGWTPPSDAVNRVKKGVVNGRPKLRMEKPKPPVKLTYFRKKTAKPATRWQKIARLVSTLEHGPYLGPIQDINLSGAVRILEKGEKSWAGPSPASPVCLAIPANGLSESPDATASGRIYQLDFSKTDSCQKLCRLSWRAP